MPVSIIVVKYLTNAGDQKKLRAKDNSYQEEEFINGYGLSKLSVVTQNQGCLLPGGPGGSEVRSHQSFINLAKSLWLCFNREGVT